MRLTTTAGLLALSSLLGSVVAHNIQLGSHSRECFHETLHKDDKMTVTFQVGDREFGGAGNLDIDFWVCFCVSVNLLIAKQDRFLILSVVWKLMKGVSHPEIIHS